MHFFAELLRASLKPTNLLFLTVIITLAVTSVVYAYRRITRQAKARLWEALEILKAHDRHSVYRDYESVGARLRGIEGFGDSWREFGECLFPEAEHATVRNSLNPREFFNEDLVFGRYMDMSMVHGMPPVLTGLGILGTFVGLFLGLTGVELTSTASMKLSIEGLIAGTSIAFVTSIYGISFSILVSAALGWIYADARGVHQALLAKIDEIFIRHTEEDYLLRIEQLTEKQLNQLENLAMDLVEPLEKAMTAAVSSAITPAITLLTEAVADLASYKRETTESAVQGMLDTFLGSLTGVAGEQSKNLAATLNQAADKMNETAALVSGIVGQLQETTAANGQTIDSAVSSIVRVEGVIKNLEQLLGSLRAQTESIQSVGTENLDLINVIQRAGNETRTSLEGLQQSAGTLGSMVDHMRTMVQEQKAAGAQFEALKHSTVELVSAINSSAVDVTAYRDAVSATLAEQRALLDEYNRTYTQFVAAVSGVVASANAVQSAGTQLDKLLNTLNSTGDQLRDSTSVHQQALQQFRQELAGVLQEMTRATTSAGELWSKHKESFDTLSDAVNGGIQLFTRQVEESLDKTLGEFDGHMAKAVKSFAASIDELDEHFESLNEILENATGRKG